MQQAPNKALQARYRLRRLPLSRRGLANLGASPQPPAGASIIQPNGVKYNPLLFWSPENGMCYNRDTTSGCNNNRRLSFRVSRFKRVHNFGIV